MEIVVALIGSLGATLIALIGLYGSSRLGIGANQEKLVHTLTEIVEAQEKKIEQMQEYIKERDKIIEVLERRVNELETLTIAQSQKLAALGNLER
jgi:uncharacterized coiled-coil protein SlyX